MMAITDMTAAVTNTEAVGMTTTVTITEDAGMTATVTVTETVATTMFVEGVCIGLMSTGKEFMPRRRSTMNRPHRRESVSFSHPS